VPILYIATSPHFEYDDSRYMIVPCSTIDYVGFEASEAMSERSKAVERLNLRWDIDDFDLDSLPDDVSSLGDLAAYGYKVWKFEVDTDDLSDMRMILTPLGGHLGGWKIASVVKSSGLAEALSRAAADCEIETSSMRAFADAVSIRHLKEEPVLW
jgi:hypothetical protein